MVVKKRRAKPLLIILIAFVILVIGLIVAGFVSWNILTGPVDKNDDAKIEVVIPNGTTTIQIASILKDKDLIKNELIFRAYVKINDVKYLKASTYHMNKTMDLKQIVTMLETGNSYNPD